MFMVVSHDGIGWGVLAEALFYTITTSTQLVLLLHLLVVTVGLASALQVAVAVAMLLGMRGKQKYYN